MKDPTLSPLKKKLQEYYPDFNLPMLEKAFTFANEKHKSQTRSSGEPYIIHPLEVALILAELHLDLESIITGLLHDTIEDTGATLQEIESMFGPSISSLVDGVTKISRIHFHTTAEKQSENFRKMIVAMAKDLRVILVKLADRTHNMRTLKHLKEQKRRSIAQETLDIYAPLANRLGIHQMKAELEDLCLQNLKPETYSKLENKLLKNKGERENYIQKVQNIVGDELKGYSISGELSGRIKHFYSIYKKMERRNLDFEDINDIIAFRIIVDNITECYKALGVIHATFKPIPGRFKDYIAMPKANNYQSLHTTVLGPFGERLEIQIRTEEMHKIANVGIAAHWKYKENYPQSWDKSHMNWLARLMEAHRNLTDPNEFLESVKINLYQTDVYVFTPNGEVKEFASGSTPIDFAYSIHTDVGHNCTGAKVNGKIVPLRYKLRNGDTVEILTSPAQRPSKDWLRFVQTSRAISRLRAYFRQEERKKALYIGKKILAKELNKFKLNIASLKKEGYLENILNKAGNKAIEDLYINIGFGRIFAKDIINKAIPPNLLKKFTTEEDKQESFFSKVLSSAAKKSGSRNAVVVDGMDDVLIRFGKCCSPIAGDPIVGNITRGRGVTIHSSKCPRSIEIGSERKIAVVWNKKKKKGKDYEIKRPVKLKVLCEDIPGILADMTKSISAENVNISQASVQTIKDNKAICIFEVMVLNTIQLQKLISVLEAKKAVISATRM